MATEVTVLSNEHEMDILLWCCATLPKGTWHQKVSFAVGYGSTYYFDNPEEATLFRLKWIEYTR